VKPQDPTLCQAIWLDPAATLQSVEQSQLAAAGWSVSTVHTLDELFDQATQAHAVVLRLRFDDAILRSVQEQLASVAPHCVVVCRLDAEALDLAVRVTQLGVTHVVSAQDWNSSTWRQLAQRIQNKPASVSAAKAHAAPVRSAVFVDPSSQKLLALAQRVAQAEVTALLVGPTGAGKEVLARVLHEASPRARGPFVGLNCAAMPEQLIEDLLFGHDKGAFTGAHRDHKGLFEQAQGGTIFLDEIGEMPLHLQAKLLRVLQERELTRLGGQGTMALDVRVVAATNKDLRRAIAEKEFREDLYYRLATFQLRLLPLTDRPGDIVPLALQCLSEHSKAPTPWQINPDAQAQLLQYPWPGNVRELHNVMRRAMVLATQPVITPDQLMFDDWQSDVGADFQPQAAQVLMASQQAMLALPDNHREPIFGTTAFPSSAGLSSAVKNSEQHMILAALAATRSRNEAAERLGISPRTLRYKLAQLRERGVSLAAC
jgi:two-component system response regulator FlrC